MPSKKSGVAIILDVVSIKESGLKVDEPVSLNLSEIPLDSVLKHLLRPLELTYVLEDDVLHVTTFEVCCQKLTTGFYPVSDLVTEEIDSLKELVRLLQGETDGLWEEMDGSGGTIYVSRATNSLVVRNTDEVHEQIHQLLTFLRAAKRIGEERVKSAIKPAPGVGQGGQQVPQKGGGFF